jgi:beta-aspartyl-peptidase (threonine type)
MMLFAKAGFLTILATILLLAAPAAPARRAHPSHNRGDDRSAITAVLKKQQEAWNQGDVDTFLQGYWRSPELTFSGSGGIARGWDGVLARYKEHYPNREAMGQLEFSGLEIRFLGKNAALVLGHWHLTRQKGDAGGVFSLVFEYFPGGWRIIHDHTSEVPAAEKNSEKP